MRSTGGPLESVMIGYPAGHYFSGPERKGRRPNSAPGYCLGHPADLWITAMRPRREGTASRDPVQAVTGGGQTPARHGGRVTRTGAETACVTPPDVPLLIIGARAQ